MLLSLVAGVSSTEEKFLTLIRKRDQDRNFGSTTAQGVVMRPRLDWNAPLQGAFL